MPLMPWQRGSWHVASWLTLVCFTFFLLEFQMGPDFGPAFGFHPQTAVQGMAAWQYVTYPFYFGGSPLAFIFTVLILFVMGSALEAMWGSAQFLIFLLVSIFGASGMAAILGVPLHGMSGLHFNLLLLYAIHFPDAVFTLWLIVFVPVRVKYLAVVGAAAMAYQSFASVPPSANVAIAGIAMLSGNASGLIYWAVRLRAGRAARRARSRVMAAAEAIVPRRDAREEARALVETTRQLALRLAEAVPAPRDRELLEVLERRIAAGVNVCPPDYFDAAAHHCGACNGFVECCLRSTGLVTLPARKQAGTTATGASEAISAHSAREQAARRRARLRVPRPATEL